MLFGMIQGLVNIGVVSNNSFDLVAEFFRVWRIFALSISR
jgi:hypothetical protein